MQGMRKIKVMMLIGANQISRALEDIQFSFVLLLLMHWIAPRRANHSSGIHTYSHLFIRVLRTLYPSG